MSRYVSFGVLIAVILFLGIIFYRVMAAFILPIFLATVLVVVFGPVHKWVLQKTNQRKTLASAITTTIIGLAVILPIGGVGVIAFGEARHLFKSLTSGGMEQYLKRIRKSLSLEMPAPMEFRDLEQSVRALDVRNVEELSEAEKQLDRIAEAADRLELELNIPKPNSSIDETFDAPKLESADIEFWREFRDAVRNAREQQLRLVKLQAIDGNLEIHTDEQGFKGSQKKESDGSDGENPNVAKDDRSKPEENVQTFESEFRQAMGDVILKFDQFRLQTLGGGFYAYFKEMANPSPKEFEKYNETVIKWIRENFLSLGGRASQFLIGVIVNIVIMMIAVFFFLLDGAKMIAAIKFFSPLDDRHEQELIDEFGKVCRAVMVATLIAAAVQGVLAGIGYYFAGVEAVFLLTLATGFFAMVPFVGAASVWIPTSLYLYLVDDRLVAALLLAVWGAGVVSTIDNVIKPYILHGQSNIHPLLALLSVLGGVSALGPIGILVGPMVVVFLQTTLTVLHREIKEMDLANGDQDGTENSNSNAGDGPNQTSGESTTEDQENESSETANTTTETPDDKDD